MGVIIASYMAGLTLGALLPAERRFPGAAFAFSCACTVAGAAAGLILMGTTGLFGAELAALLAFSTVTLVLGASGGLAFRGAAVALERDGASPGGLIYALDILGTSLGGLLAGSVLVPFLGLAGTVLLAGGINIVLPLLALCVLIAGGRVSRARV
jgi:hypothetical protein